jgi:YesN/AraC family two-component response regulator
MEILVVDDNILDRKYIKYLIENHIGVSPTTSKDGEDALNKIKKNTFDLVITDIVMPKIEGIELISHIKSISPSTKIIAISGENPYYLYIVKKLGIEMVFTKPLDTDKFLQGVQKILNSRPQKILS